MELSPNTIKPAHGSKRHSHKQLGRGNGSGKGTMSGRGGKGQTARSGGKHRTEIRGMRVSLKIPKVRGFHSIKPKMETITLRDLDRVGLENKEITPAYLKEMSVIGKPQNGVKIVASARLPKTNNRWLQSQQKATELIEKAGGKITFNIRKSGLSVYP